jgi:hypothetical protein
VKIGVNPWLKAYAGISDKLKSEALRAAMNSTNLDHHKDTKAPRKPW